MDDARSRRRSRSPAQTACRASRPAAPSGSCAASGPSGRSRILRTKASAGLVLGDDGDLLFLQLRKRLDLLAAGAEQQHADRARGSRACAPAGGTLASVRRTARLACLRSNCVSALALSPLVHDLEPQARGVVLQHGGEPGRRSSASGPLGVADGKDQRLRISQPGPAAPHRGEPSAIRVSTTNSRIWVRIALDRPWGAAAAVPDWRGRGFSTHGMHYRRLMPDGGPPCRASRRAPDEFVNV